LRLIDGLLDYQTAWSLPDVKLFTGNKTITKDGRLVMGRGAAKAVRDFYPGIDKRIKVNKSVSFTQITDDQYLGYFCVKDHFAENAQLALIGQSAAELSALASSMQSVTFHLNYPGIGAGGLDVQSVSRIISTLPDNVWVYQ
jgi:hypothetical protein